MKVCLCVRVIVSVLMSFCVCSPSVWQYDCEGVCACVCVRLILSVRISLCVCFFECVAV